MAKDSKIEWTHHTFNPWWGCDRVSPACKHCYAEAWAKRVGQELWGAAAPRRFLSEAYWRQPLAWDSEASRAGERKRVFCASMADVFEDRRDLDTSRARLWQLIEATPYLNWLLLTKRPQVVGDLVPWGDRWPKNVWLGATAENQRWADRRIPELLRYPAAVRFLSCEPLLGPLDLRRWLDPNGSGVNWVIAGGESGSRARPMNPDWVRKIRDDCEYAGVGFHFKQWGNWRPTANDHVNGHEVRRLRRDSGEFVIVAKIGKKAAGRVLDGREWNGIPVDRAGLLM